MKNNKTYLRLGLTLVASACLVLVFYDTFFQSRVLLDFFDKLTGAWCEKTPCACFLRECSPSRSHTNARR